MALRGLLVGLLTVAFMVAPAAAGTRTASGGGVKVTMTGPSSCTRNGTLTVTIDLEANHGGGGSAGFVYDVTLKERDVFFDDKIERQSVSGPMEPGPWSKSLTFSFKPSKWEANKTLELYFVVKRKIQGFPGLLTLSNRTNPLKVRCR